MYQGFLRLSLALLVVYTHLMPQIGGVGRMAVMCFFLVSGYLITRVCCLRYHQGLDGFRRFVLNRFLRIYPTYWAVLLLSIAIVLIFPSLAAKFHPNYVLPENLFEWLPQIAIFGLLTLQVEAEKILVLPAWSLNIELIYYLLISVLAGRSREATRFCWGGSMILALLAMSLGWNEIDKVYFSFWGPSLAFASGALLYHEAPVFERLMRRLRLQPTPVTALLSMLILTIYIQWQTFAYFGMKLFGYDYAFANSHLPGLNLAFLYGVIPLAAITFWLCDGVSVHNDSKMSGTKLKKLSALCGDLSYPIFLCHWQVAVFVTGIMAGAGVIRTCFIAWFPCRSFLLLDY